MSCCCLSCALIHHNFDLEFTNWEIISGDWATGAGSVNPVDPLAVMLVAADTDSGYYETTDNRGSIAVDFSGDARFIFGWKAVDDYWYFDEGTAVLHHVEGATDTEFTPIFGGTVLGEPHFADAGRICWWGNQVVIDSSVYYAPGNKDGGIGLGSQASVPTVTYVRFSYWVPPTDVIQESATYPYCTACVTCEATCPDGIPDEVEVYIPPGTIPAGYGGSILNGNTFVVPRADAEVSFGCWGPQWPGDPFSGSFEAMVFASCQYRLVVATGVTNGFCASNVSIDIVVQITRALLVGAGMSFYNRTLMATIGYISDDLTGCRRSAVWRNSLGSAAVEETAVCQGRTIVCSHVPPLGTPPFTWACPGVIGSFPDGVEVSL